MPRPLHERQPGFAILNVGRLRVRWSAPAAVRVEAGWDRSSPQWAFINRLRIADVVLDAVRANTAAAIRGRAQVSVADAHIGATVQSAPDAEITVITSDPEDIRRVAGGRAVTVVAI
jgi:predicted nucleic acid-binding protein